MGSWMRTNIIFCSMIWIGQRKRSTNDTSIIFQTLTIFCIECKKKIRTMETKSLRTFCKPNALYCKKKFLMKINLVSAFYHKIRRKSVATSLALNRLVLKRLRKKNNRRLLYILCYTFSITMNWMIWRLERISFRFKDKK